MSHEDTAPIPDIRALCRSWREAAASSGGIAIGEASEQFRLHRNGVRFHDLSYEQLRDAAVGLTEILLLPGMNTIVDLDHSLFWSWSAELLISLDGPLSMRSEREISGLAETAVRVALANVRAPTPEAFEEARAASELLDNNSRQLLVRSHSVLPYVAFPLLEAVCRRACHSYVDLRGRVLREFPRRSGRDYKPGDRCSSVADVLSLLVNFIAEADLASDIREVLDHVAKFETAVPPAAVPDGYRVLFDWRNSSLHGETSLSTIGGTVLSLALMIALEGLKSDYSQYREAALARARREVDMVQVTGRWNPSPWSYYPPFP